MVLRNWLLGKRISEEELRGEDRAEYGLEVVKRLSVTDYNNKELVLEDIDGRWLGFGVKLDTENWTNFSSKNKNNISKNF